MDPIERYGNPVFVLYYRNKLNKMEGINCVDIARNFPEKLRYEEGFDPDDSWIFSVETEETQRYRECLKQNKYTSFSEFRDEYYRESKILEQSFKDGKYSYNNGPTNLIIHKRFNYLGYVRVLERESTRYEYYHIRLSCYQHNVCGGYIEEKAMFNNDKRISSVFPCTKCGNIFYENDVNRDEFIPLRSLNYKDD